MVLYGMFVGFYGSERTERSLVDFPVKDDDAEEEKKFNEELNRWKRTETGWFDQYISLPIL